MTDPKFRPLDAAAVERIISAHGILGARALPAYVRDGSPTSETDKWFKHHEHGDKEFVVLRLGEKDYRVFLPATGKQLNAYLAELKPGE
jgi:hypothetical protein